MNPSLDVVIPCYNAAETLRAAAESALKQQKTVVFISLEMSSESIVDRILSEVAGVPMYKLNGSEQMNEEDFSKI